jgi:hypothetical protein
LLACLISTSSNALAQDQRLKIDFGGSDAQTSLPPVFWNNLTPEIANTDEQIDLVDSAGNTTNTQLVFVQFFDDESNRGGTESSDDYPSSASRDSLVKTVGNASIAFVTTGDFDETFSITFFASDLSASDNRETQYEVDGASVKSAVLNPSGNINDSVEIRDVGLDGFGEFLITVSAGPNHSSENSIVYLGALRIDSSAGWSALVDLGEANATTSIVSSAPSFSWNNVTSGVADTDDGVLENIVSVQGNASDLVLQMISRFNGVNQSGTDSSPLFPATASRDSYFANTEEFGVGPDVTPVFKIGGLVPANPYRFTFFASRMGVGGDNRQTVYTLNGAGVEETHLNPSDNIEDVAVVEEIRPDVGGEVSIALTPGPDNNNGFHFIYLGAMKIESLVDESTYLFDFGGGATTEIDVVDDERWNNVTESIATSDDGALNSLVNVSGGGTGIGLQMASRFNGVNRNGTTESILFPSSATQDSLYGNTEAFNGLEDVVPSFKLTGLNPVNQYSITFFGSRTATDNRETLYTVSGSNSGEGILNVSSNVDQQVTVEGIMPDAASEITVSIESGPSNDNSNHFTYLGAVQVDWKNVFVPRILVDVGGTAFATSTDDQGNVWNNFQGAVGQTDDGVLADLVSVGGGPTGIGLQMIARFNGVNQAGTEDSSPYPSTATHDSLFGNVEEFNGRSDVLPAFMLTGLDPTVACDLIFYGSWLASDNRETAYRLSGEEESIVSLNVAGNIDQTARAEGVVPAADGTIRVSLEPGLENDNGNHFIYLGVLQIDWEGQAPALGDETVSLANAAMVNGQFRFTLMGRVGETYTVRGSDDLELWRDVKEVTLSGDSTLVEINTEATVKFFRVER